ncbi:MAG: family peptidase [Rickettsiaceae bacterium]|jgi:predicted Zn-dependent protease|nr:family peptidase [Rickettsiaceae bacterium]
MRNISARSLDKALFKIVLLILLQVNVYAQDIIRDSEIENTVRQVADPVIRAAGFKPNDIDIYIINDDSINAFTPGSKEIYLHSGLIKNFEQPDILRGVIAHELGHIVGGHRPAQAQKAQEYSLAAMSAIGLGLAMSGALKDFAPGFAIALGGVHYAERSILYYSRIDESLADKSALRFLEASGHTSKGLIELMEKLYAENRSISKYVNPYDLTHPLSEARLSSIKRFYQNSKHKNSCNGETLLKSYKRARIKLKAFTDDPAYLVKLYANKDDELAKYLKAIVYFRKSNKPQALSNINQLLEAHPNDPYYNELKGQILFEFGNAEALQYYDNALNKLPNDTLLKLSNAIVRLNIYKASSPELKAVETNLKQVLFKEKNNLTALYYLSMYYDKIGKKSKSLLEMATFFKKKGEIKQAKAYAKQAINGFKLQSPEWYRAHDIVSFAE